MYCWKLALITIKQTNKQLQIYWSIGLWQKLQKSNIKGKIFTVIYNMYQNIKTRVKHGNELSEYFISHTGVKQG